MAFHVFLFHTDLIPPTDSLYYVTDPNSKHVPVEKLLSPVSPTHSVVLLDHPITRLPFRSIWLNVQSYLIPLKQAQLFMYVCYIPSRLLLSHTLQGNPVNSSDTVYF